MPQAIGHLLQRSMICSWKDSSAPSGTFSATLLSEGSLELSLVSLAENMRLRREVKVGFFGGPAGRASPLEGDLTVEVVREA